MIGYVKISVRFGILDAPVFVNAAARQLVMLFARAHSQLQSCALQAGLCLAEVWVLWIVFSILWTALRKAPFP